MKIFSICIQCLQNVYIQLYKEPVIRFYNRPNFLRKKLSTCHLRNFIKLKFIQTLIYHIVYFVCIHGAKETC